MNRFFLITFQWSTGDTRRTITITGVAHDASDKDAFANIMIAANNQGIPTGAHIIAFHLEQPR